jgi:WD40 repeat protein
VEEYGVRKVELVYAKGSVAGCGDEVQPALFTCASLVGEAGHTAVGASNGSIYIFGVDHLAHTKLESAHVGGITALCLHEKSNLVSGGKDGMLRIWETDLRGGGLDIPKKEVNIAAASTQGMAQGSDLKSIRGAATGLDIHQARIVIGTRENEVFEYDLSLGSVKRLMGAHGAETWGLACHPTRAVIATCGDDKLLRIWDPTSREPLEGKSLQMPYAARSLGWSYAGGHIAVGFREGPTLGPQPKAMAKPIVPVWVLDSETLAHVASFEDAEEYISAVSFSPDDSKLATGSWDQQVRVYDVTDWVTHKDKRLLWTFSGNSSSVEHVQWSLRSEVLMSNSKACEMLYWEVATGARINKTSMLRDMEWDQWTCVLGWPVMGIWDPGYDQTDVNAVCQSHYHPCLTLADDYGQLKLMRYPLPVNYCAAAASYRGHSAHVTNTRWLFDDSLVISTGGNDYSIFQWRFQADTPPEEACLIPAEVRTGASLAQRSASPTKASRSASPSKSTRGGGSMSPAKRRPTKLTQQMSGGPRMVDASVEVLGLTLTEERRKWKGARPEKEPSPELRNKYERYCLGTKAGREMEERNRDRHRKGLEPIVPNEGVRVQLGRRMAVLYGPSSLTADGYKTRVRWACSGG